jgi:integrase
MDIDESLAPLHREGRAINKKTVGKYMQEMGLTALYPGPNLSKRAHQAAIYPYLLRNITATAPNHIWGIDITYIRLHAGWMYLVAVLDWYSRYIVSWELDQHWVFYTEVGTPLDPTTMLRYSFWPLLERADIPRLRFHDLRHSSATLLLVMGVHPKVVQELLGHSNISMTLDTYSHTIPCLQAEAMSQLNTLLQLKPQHTAEEKPVAVTVAVKAEPRTVS